MLASWKKELKAVCREREDTRRTDREEIVMSTLFRLKTCRSGEVEHLSSFPSDHREEEQTHPPLTTSPRVS